jgi:uncharacterized protein DUF4416
MGTPREPKPAKYFVALLSSSEEYLNGVESDLANAFGTIDSRSETLSWTISRFYEKEMGPRLLRRFVSFEPLQSPENLAEMKLISQQLEEKQRSLEIEPSGRRVNIDPGYLEAGKVVLASTKNASQRIYLRSGIYAEATLLYYEGGFHGCSYTYPDYLWPETQVFLTSLRSIYLNQLRAHG